MKKLNYSVLMSVYCKEKPAFLHESIQSMLDQTVKPNEIVLVKDGPLTDELNKILNVYKNNKLFKIIELKNNVGLGKALSIGLKHCENELVARMDTDDISVLNRCEKQLKLFVNNKHLSVVGTAVAEFIDHQDNIISYKEVKTEHTDIRKFMKFRNPLNHPSVMFKKNDVLKVGNYRHWLLNEDYYLWIRMLQHGFIMQNINEPLVKMRITDDTYLRRGGWNYFINQKRLFDYMLKNGLINYLEYLYNNSIRIITRILLPNKLRKYLYLRILRKKVG